jgi:peptidoglycan/LPS O-acetylase OafA/YrhL
MLSMERMGLSGRALFSKFLIRRVFGIYPLSVLIVVVAIILKFPPTSWADSYVWPGWSEVLSNVFLFQDFTHAGSVICVLWSLPFEVQMYAILPALFLLLLRYTSMRAVAMIWLTGIVIAVLEYVARNRMGDLDFLITRYIPASRQASRDGECQECFDPNFQGHYGFST